MKIGKTMNSLGPIFKQLLDQLLSPKTQNLGPIFNSTTKIYTHISIDIYIYVL